MRALLMERVGVTAAGGLLVGLVAVVAAGVVLGNPGIGTPEVITGAAVGVAAFLVAMAGERAAAWTSLGLAVLTCALAVWMPVGLVFSVVQSVGWEVGGPLWLLGGAVVMAVATLAGIRLARAAWRREVPPMASVMGTALALLMALIGAGLLLTGVSFFPGPLPGDLSSIHAPVEHPGPLVH